jgi:catechol 2,3-dioxygenase
MSVQSLLGYALTVPDIEPGRRFYQDFGLSGAARGNALGLRCGDDARDTVTLEAGKGRRLNHLNFGASAEGLKALKANIESRGGKLLDPPASEPGAAFAVRDPDNNLIVVREAARANVLDRRKTLIATEAAKYTRSGGNRGCPPRDMVVKPWRLGHVLLFTPDVDRQIAFYTDMLGMKLSDRSGPVIAFLRVAGGSDHHVIAFAKSDRPGYHHASFEVGGVDHVGFGAASLIGKGYRSGWGFGRHVIGSNYFHYIRDPWGSLAEYFFDIDYIADDAAWQANDWPLEDSLYLWGPNVPEDFVQNFDAEA